MSDTTPTRPPIVPTLTRAAQVINNPIVQLVDRFLIWIAVGFGALLVMGGRTWLNGQIDISPAVVENRRALTELAVAQKKTTETVTDLATSIKILSLQNSLHEKAIDRLETRRP